jgi:hypothetical protein
VERHAAVPQLQYLDRVPQILAEIVEQDVAEPAAEDDPEGGIENQVVGMAAGERRTRLLEQFQQVPVADEDAGQVSEAVPPEVEWPDVQRDRGNAQIGELDEAAVVDGLQGLPHECSAPHKAGRDKGKGAGNIDAQRA